MASTAKQAANHAASIEHDPAAYVSPVDKVDYPGFSFSTHQPDPSSRARLGKITTPHGVVETPNFIFCATKAAMKSATPDQVRAENAQIILSNTYHLMLAPGPDIVEAMGGLQKMTGWNGPMLTDSGGYQIFSMGFGSVSNEIKGSRNTEAMGWSQSLVSIKESGAKFKSYVDSSIQELTPEKSIDIQRKLGADLIVVLDECTPFNVDKSYTELSMRRSHRWAVRSLKEFLRQAQPPPSSNVVASDISITGASSAAAATFPTNTTSKYYGKQALYGIVQGGVYEEMRKESTDFINRTPFFGTAIGGSLGASREEMHRIVTLTRGMVRDDRPCHLLGIGGVRDIFHGVRQGVDTFDCVHPSRLGRHGGALVKAAFWEEEPHTTTVETVAMRAEERRKKKMEKRQQRSQIDRQLNKEKTSTSFDDMGALAAPVQASAPAAPVNATNAANAADDVEVGRKRRRGAGDGESAADTTDTGSTSGAAAGSKGAKKLEKAFKLKEKTVQAIKIKEHMNVDRAAMRYDPRVIDPTCGCYTCKNGNGFARGYLHHLFKAKELLGGTLVTIHNVHFMTRLMASIREGIANGTLDEVEREYVHPDLKDSAPVQAMSSDD